MDLIEIQSIDELILLAPSQFENINRKSSNLGSQLRHLHNETDRLNKRASIEMHYVNLLHPRVLKEAVTDYFAYENKRSYS